MERILRAATASVRHTRASSATTSPSLGGGGRTKASECALRLASGSRASRLRLGASARIPLLSLRDTVGDLYLDSGSLEKCYATYN